MLLEGYIAAFAVVQAVLVTLRAGSRALYAMHNGGMIGVVDGPLILPPAENETVGSSSLFLWDLTAAFRQGVKLGLRLEEYQEGGESCPYYNITSSIFHEDEKDTYIEPYRMSLVPATATSNTEAQSDALVLDDDEIRQLLRGEKDQNDKNEYCSERKQRFWQWSRTRHENPHIHLDFTKALVTEYALDSEKIARITAYAPNCFSALRSDFGVDEESFRKALLDSGPFVSFQSNSKGAARSGGVFFLTRDGSYIVKTIKRDEARTLLKMLPKYTEFMKENGRQTLLTRFFGLYQVRLKDTSSNSSSSNRETCHYIVIMNSVFPAEASKLITERFDLKGSTVGREASIEERKTKGSHAVLKDLDLQREVERERDEVQNLTIYNDVSSDKRPNHVRYGLHIGPTAKKAFMSQLRMDVGLLQDCFVIDYSLLVGVSSAATNAGRRISHDASLPRSRRLRKKFRAMIRSTVLVPFQIILAPSFFLFRKGEGRITAWPPLVPYYQSYECGIDSGQLSRLRGERKGEPALYYFGLIDFLQPFDTVAKFLEYKLKGLVYEKDAYSCVPPDLYARRFLSFVDAHIS